MNPDFWNMGKKWDIQNLDTQEDYWNIGNIGSRHTVIPKLGPHVPNLWIHLLG